MKAFLAELRRALDGGPRRERPPPAPVAAETSLDERIEMFRHALKRERGQFVEVDSYAEADRVVAGLGDGEIVSFDAEPDADSIRRAAVGVDRADALIAETGTVVRSYASAAASRISLLPAISVFIASTDRLFGTLPEALAMIEERHRSGPAYTLLVTGPSRTADIEKQLVIPAHGPRELVVVLCHAPMDRYTR
jgi:L-lactate dehydrogenase complex protein LldG